jgi:hypothetical protein
MNNQPRIPHGDKGIDKKHCQTLYWNLLQSAKTNHTLPSHFIRELEQTRRCDSVAQDLSFLRENYRTHFNEQMEDPEAYTKLIQSKVRSEETEYAATQTTLHYVAWTEENLINALNWKKKLYYITVYKAENTFTTIGILTTAYGGYKGLRKL